MKKQKMLIPVAGMFHNRENGVKVGDVVELDDEYALRYRHLGYTEDLDADELTADQRKARADEARAAFDDYGRRQLERIERQRQEALQPILAGTGERIDPAKTKGRK